VKKLAKCPRTQNAPIGNQRLTAATFEVFDFFTPSEGEGWGEGEAAGVIASRWPALLSLPDRETVTFKLAQKTEA
jgi:hypothetical protein